MCEEYNGWSNRETWALQLWLTNDQGLYEMTRERVADALAAPAPEWAAGIRDYRDNWRDTVAGAAVKAFWDELTDPGEGLMSADKILAMVRDIGSEYRVDWDEIGAHWLDES